MYILWGDAFIVYENHQADQKNKTEINCWKKCTKVIRKNFFPNLKALGAKNVPRLVIYKLLKMQVL